MAESTLFIIKQFSLASVAFLIVYLIPKMLPLSEIKRSGLSRQELHERYGKAYAFYVIVSSVAAVVVCGLSYLAFKALYSLIGPKAGVDTIYLLRIESNSIFGLLAIFFGLGMTGVLATIWSKRRVGSKYGEFEEYMNLVHGANYTRISYPLYSAITVVSLIFYGFLLDHRVDFKRDAIEIKPVFSFLSRSHKYSEISGIRLVRYVKPLVGKTIFRPHYVIEFKDGTSWSSDNNLGRTAESMFTKWSFSGAVNYAAERAGVEVTESEL